MPTFQHGAQLFTSAVKGTYNMERIGFAEIMGATQIASVDWILSERNGFRDPWCRSPPAADGGRQKNQMRLTAFVGWSGTPHLRGKKEGHHMPHVARGRSLTSNKRIPGHFQLLLIYRPPSHALL